MRRARRILKYFALVAIPLVAAAVLGLRPLVESSVGRGVVAGRLSSAVGLPVRVDRLAAGPNTTTLTLTLPGESSSSTATVELDVGLADLAFRGFTPTAVRVRDAVLSLELTAAGKLVNAPPDIPAGGAGTPFPEVAVENARISVRRAGRPNFSLGGISGTLVPAGNVVTIHGTAADGDWGKWDIGGTIDRAAGRFRVELTSPGTTVTLGQLQSIPYIPPEVWEHVRPAGATAARVRLGNTDGEFAYDVRITPTAATVVLPDLDATLEGVRGTVDISGENVTLTDCQARLAGGNVGVRGVMDFRGPTAVLKLAVSAETWDVEKLPPAWGLPERLAGRLRGAADLKIVIHDGGRVEPDGTGTGEVEGATLNGIPIGLTLNLRSDGKRLRLDGAKPPPAVRKSRRQAAAQPPAPAAPATLDASITLKDVDLPELLQKLDITPGYKVAGKVTVVATLGIPLGEPEKSKKYRLAGKFSSPELTLEGLKLLGVTADIGYSDGVLTLSNLVARLPAAGGKSGGISGSASVAVDPPGDAVAKLKLVSVPLGEALKALPGFAADLSGDVTGTIDFKGPFAKLADVKMWTGSADLTSPAVRVFGRVVANVAAVVTLADRTATLGKFSGVAEGVPVAGDGSVGLAKPYTYAAKLTATPTPADLRKLVPELGVGVPLAGKLAAAATAAGTFDPFRVTLTGTAAVTELAVAGTTGNTASVKWELTQDRVKLSDITAAVFRGTITGTAEIPFAADKAGAFDLKFRDIDTAAASKTVADFPVRIDGRASGNVTGTIPAAKPGQPRGADIDLALTAPKLSVQGVPAEKLSGKLTVAGKAVQYQLEGKTLGGSFEVKGKYPGKERGSLRVEGLDLRRLAAELRVPELAPLRGTFAASLDFDGDFSAGSGRVELRDLRWGGVTLALEVTGGLRLLDGVLETADLGGGFAGGSLRGRGRVFLDGTNRNYLALTLDRADGKKLFAPIPALAGAIEGEIGAAVRLRFGRDFHASGTVSIGRGKVLGVTVVDARIPFDLTTAGGYTKLAVRDAAGTVARGRVTAETVYESGAGSRLSGQVKFSDVKVGGLVSDLDGVSAIGAGRATGRFDFASTALTTADDLTGTLTATLADASTQELPIVRVLGPFLSPIGVLAPFTKGELQARLSRGVFRVSRLDLANNTAQFHADGTITLAGRLNLHVIANTGRVGPDTRFLRVFGLRLPPIGPVPITLVRDVTEFLSNRTVRLSVDGTTKTPVVRVDAAALLTDEAVRFFLGRYVLTATPTAATK